LGWLRLDLVRLLILALPAFVANWFLSGTASSFAENPERAAVVLLPLLAIGFGLSRLLRRDRAVTLGSGFLFFFVVFCLAFSIATTTDPLIGRRTAQAPVQDDDGFGEAHEQLGRSDRFAFLKFNRLGDWHYWFAPQAPTANDLLVITLEPSQGQLRGEARRRFAFLIRQAVANGARGLAFDFYMERETPADGFLGRLIQQADEAGVPILFGYRPREEEGVLRPTEPPDTLAEHLPDDRMGHLAGYREADGRLRMVPLALVGDREMRAISVRIAEILHGGSLTPLPDRLLQFTEPRWGVPTVRFSPEVDWSRMRDRFVLVGTESAHDLRLTPFGEVRGVVIHAFAAHGLRTGHHIHRLGALFIFPLLFGACYLLTLRYAQGIASRRLVLLAAGLSLSVVALAALAMWVDLLWITVSFPLVAIWLLTGLLLGIRARRAALVASETRIGQVETPAIEQQPGQPKIGDAIDIPAVPAAAEGVAFDVFLSHNSKDKPTVIELGLALRDRGLEPWLDIWELTPGHDWQMRLEETLSTVRSSAVMVGADGLGPWEIPEMRASLSESVRRGIPVIPVLLPGAPKQPVLPLFLTQFTWVDLRGGITQEGIDRLEWGITGVKPSRKAA